MDGKDRRVSERRHTIYFSEVHNKNERSLMGYVVDMSMAGLMILTKKKIDVGGLFQLEIVLPEELEGRDRLNIRAKSMWCKKDANPEYYIVGLELEDMSTMDEEILMDYIRLYGY